MKTVKLLFMIIILAKAGYMSGRVKEVELKDMYLSTSNIFRVKIVGDSKARVKEIEEKMGKKASPEFHLYRAVVIEQLHFSDQFDTNEENWTLLFSSPEDSNSRMIEGGKISIPDAEDTIIIMDQEYISQSMIYHVKGLRKIFIHYRCPDAAERIKTGETYLFISDKLATSKNGVYYGNIDFGLYPDTEKIREKITSVLEKPDR
ncbi:MAG: hypothetical protein ACLFVE_13555 [Chitinispirillaceae bacterium]